MGTRCLRLLHRQGEGQATISLFFDVKTPDELKVIFIEYVHRHLAKYGSGVTRDRRYVCPKCEQPAQRSGPLQLAASGAQRPRRHDQRGQHQRSQDVPHAVAGGEVRG